MSYCRTSLGHAPIFTHPHPSPAPHFPPFVGTVKWNRRQERFTPAIPNTPNPFQMKGFQSFSLKRTKSGFYGQLLLGGR